VVGTPGAKIPVRVPDLSKLAEQVAHTKHLTSFQKTTLGVYTILDDNDVCVGYRLQLVDTQEHHTYNYDFGADLFEDTLKQMNAMPKIGEKAEGVAPDNVTPLQ